MKARSFLLFISLGVFVSCSDKKISESSDMESDSISVIHRPGTADEAQRDSVKRAIDKKRQEKKKGN